MEDLDNLLKDINDVLTRPCGSRGQRDSLHIDSLLLSSNSPEAQQLKAMLDSVQEIDEDEDDIAKVQAILAATSESSSNPDDIKKNLKEMGAASDPNACPACELGEYMAALGHMYHLECFMCSSCKKSLLNDPFFDVEECNKCGADFENNNFVEYQEKAYCAACHNKLYAPDCAFCKERIHGECVKACGKCFHQNHFVCWECKVPFTDNIFFEFNGLPYCDKHFHKVSGSLCAMCNEPIHGAAVSAIGKKYHPEHFQCAYCMKQIAKEPFKVMHQKPYCVKCHTKLFM